MSSGSPLSNSISSSNGSVMSGLQVRALTILYCGLGRAVVDDVRVGQHVDAGSPAGGEGTLDGGANVFGPLDQLTVAAQRLDHLVVADAGREVGGGRMPQDRLLRVLDLRPLPVVADHRDHWQVMAHHRLHVHA